MTSAVNSSAPLAVEKCTPGYQDPRLAYESRNNTGCLQQLAIWPKRGLDLTYPEPTGIISYQLLSVKALSVRISVHWFSHHQFKMPQKLDTNFMRRNKKFVIRQKRDRT